MSARPFIDSNVIVYAFADGDRRRERAADVLASGGLVSVQVLNEFVNVSRKRRKRAWDDILAELRIIGSAVETVPLLVETHRDALHIARQTDFSFHDSLLIAAASQAGCGILYSEDMQHGQTIDGVTITNPFLAPG